MKIEIDNEDYRYTIDLFDEFDTKKINLPCQEPRALLVQRVLI